MDAYRFCESRQMTLFKPDTKPKNMFLAKVTIALDQPVLFDLYRFGNRFEFQYGKNGQKLETKYIICLQGVF